jgi:NAD(P)-dependent dehydrogenase (short-subunit alcohol dehydrogenase family)
MVSTITTNLMEPIWMTSALMEHLKAKKNAVVANTCSVLGFMRSTTIQEHPSAQRKAMADDVSHCASSKRFAYAAVRADATAGAGCPNRAEIALAGGMNF